jgi:PTH1 family peptidyl-tRNA hydrolase
MNVSGASVQALLERNQIPIESLLVVYDELALPWSSIRIRSRGSSAGHHGMDSVIHSLGTQDFARLRLGVHPGHPVKDGADFLLTPFSRAQEKELDSLLDEAARAVESIIAEGVEKSMTKFNRRAQGVTTEEE